MVRYIVSVVAGKEEGSHPKEQLRIPNSIKSKSSFPSPRASWEAQVGPASLGSMLCSALCDPVLILSFPGLSVVSLSLEGNKPASAVPPLASLPPFCFPCPADESNTGS